LLEIIGVLVALTGIFFLRAKKIEYYIAITLAALIVGITSDAPIRIIFDVLIQTLSSYNTWNLVAAVALITVMGYALSETGLMIDFVEGLSQILPGSLLLAIVPAIFGFLPMLGGALMSAPFIEPETIKLGLEPEHKTYFNVWFRHLLYWINPITSSVILVVTLSGIPINTWLMFQFPMFIAMTSIGFIVSKDFISTQQKNESYSQLTLSSLKGGLPIIITVVLTLYGIPVWGSLLAGIFALIILGRVKLEKSFEVFTKGVRWDLVLSIISMLYLRDMINSSGSVVKLFEIVIASGVPVIAIAMVVPLFIGAVSGSPAMGLGIALPIMLPLFGDVNIHLISIVFLGLACAYITSPIHLCLVLTNNYFKSDLNKVIRYLAPSSFALYLFGVVYHLFLYKF
jgi:integral membrane protein (TIGR00529 family)